MEILKLVILEDGDVRVPFIDPSSIDVEPRLISQVQFESGLRALERDSPIGIKRGVLLYDGTSRFIVRES